MNGDLLSDSCPSQVLQRTFCPSSVYLVPPAGQVSQPLSQMAAQPLSVDMAAWLPTDFPPCPVLSRAQPLSPWAAIVQLSSLIYCESPQIMYLIFASFVSRIVPAVSLGRNPWVLARVRWCIRQSANLSLSPVFTTNCVGNLEPRPLVFRAPQNPSLLMNRTQKKWQMPLSRQGCKRLWLRVDCSPSLFRSDGDGCHVVTYPWRHPHGEELREASGQWLVRNWGP